MKLAPWGRTPPLYRHRMAGIGKNLQIVTKWMGTKSLLGCTMVGHTLNFDPPQEAIAFCRTQIFTKKPSSPKISCTPEGSKTTENAQKWFSQALHFVERYHFVGISCPFDRASTICMKSNGMRKATEGEKK